MEEAEETPNGAEPEPEPEPERLLGVAEKLLQSRDLNSARDFAILAQEAERLLEGSDQILAVVDVLLAAEKRLSRNHNDWYAVLQIDSTSDLDLIKRQYQRLALLLHPDKNNYAFADQAFRLVAEAWAVLSNASKKTQYDSQINVFTKVDLHLHAKQPVRRRSSFAAVSAHVAAGGGGSQSMTTFWTACPYCYELYEYPRMYEECCMRCQKCRRAFHAARIPQLPPVVPGKDEYYCCWGFFPMGFVDGKDDGREGGGGGGRGGGGGGGEKEEAVAKFPSWMPPVFPAGQESAAEAGRGGVVGGVGAGGGHSTARAGAGAPKKRGRPRKYPIS